MLKTENAALQGLAHVRGDASAYTKVSGELCCIPPEKIPHKGRASPAYVYACIKRSFVDSPPPPVFARLELMSDIFCVANEAPTPPTPVVGDARHPVTECPLNRGLSFRYIQKFKQRSSYDTVVTKADTQELFYDEYLTVEYKHANDKCMHVAKLCDSIQNIMKAAHSQMLSNHEKECMRLPLMPYQRFMKRQSFC